MKPRDNSKSAAYFNRRYKLEQAKKEYLERIRREFFDYENKLKEECKNHSLKDIIP